MYGLLYQAHLMSVLTILRMVTIYEQSVVDIIANFDNHQGLLGCLLIIHDHNTTSMLVYSF